VSKACKNCGLDTKVPFLTLDSQRLCDYCRGEQVYRWDKEFQLSADLIRQRRQELENIFASVKGRQDYDCVLALSGGKDSAYMLCSLLEQGLKVLAVHVGNIFESRLAEENINSLKAKFNFALKKISPPEDFYIKFYSELLKHSQDAGFSQVVCSACRDLYMGICLKAAVENKIPLVITGFAPPRYYFFEVPERELKRDWIPAIFKANKYPESFLDNFWNPQKFPAKTIFPRVISPFHVTGYNLREINKKLSRKQILPANKLSFFKTNCLLVKVMTYLDRKSQGYHYGIMAHAYLRRNKMMEPDQLSNKIDYALFLISVRKAIKLIEKKLGVDFKKILSSRTKDNSQRLETFW